MTAALKPMVSFILRASRTRGSIDGAFVCVAKLIAARRADETVPGGGAAYGAARRALLRRPRHDGRSRSMAGSFGKNAAPERTLAAFPKVCLFVPFFPSRARFDDESCLVMTSVQSSQP